MDVLFLARVGGIAGSDISGIANKCYVSGNIMRASFNATTIGGLVGKCFWGKITN